MIPYIELNNGVKMPSVGYGTWKLEAGKAATEAVLSAIECGYRYIDTAYSYGNDFFVGKAIKNSAVPRDELFISNKAWNTFWDREAVVECCKKSLKLMKLDHFDLYLVHWPTPITQDGWEQTNREIWYGMEQLYREGTVRAIGVSNFLTHHLDSLIKNDIEIIPAVDQIEFHPGCFNKAVLDRCNDLGIAVQGWSPLGSSNVLQYEKIQVLSEVYKKTPAQICLRWAVQHNVIPIPRSQDSLRMAQNTDIFDFDIVESDMSALDSIVNVGCSEFIPDVKHPE